MVYLQVDGGYSSSVKAINSETKVVKTLSSLSVGKTRLAGGVVENEFVAGGGSTNKGHSNTVEAINPITNTLRNLTVLSQARAYLSSGAVGEEIVFIGGNGFNVVDAINVKTNTLRVLENLNETRGYSSSTVIGSQIINGGDISESTKIISIAPITQIVGYTDLNIDYKPNYIQCRIQ